MYRKGAIAAVKIVEVEHSVAAWAVKRCREQAQMDASILTGAEIKLHEILLCSEQLEPTYVIRLFAVFESYLRDIWARAFKRDTFPATRDLVDGCAARHRVRGEVIVRTHKVREYRNSLVHGGEAARVAILDARRDLCAFIHHMPPQ